MEVRGTHNSASQRFADFNDSLAKITLIPELENPSELHWVDIANAVIAGINYQFQILLLGTYQDDVEHHLRNKNIITLDDSHHVHFIYLTEEQLECLHSIIHAYFKKNFFTPPSKEKNIIQEMELVKKYVREKLIQLDRNINLQRKNIHSEETHIENYARVHFADLSEQIEFINQVKIYCYRHNTPPSYINHTLLNEICYEFLTMLMMKVIARLNMHDLKPGAVENHLKLCRYYISHFECAIGNSQIKFAVESATRNFRRIFKTLKQLCIPDDLEMSVLEKAVEYITERPLKKSSLKSPAKVTIDAAIKMAINEVMRESYIKSHPEINSPAFNEYVISHPNWHSDIENIQFFFSFKSRLLIFIFNEMDRLKISSECTVFSKLRTDKKLAALDKTLDAVDQAQSAKELFIIIENMLANKDIIRKRNIFGLFSSTIKTNLKEFQTTMVSECKKRL